MARTHRPHQPGAAFHIVSRTQGHAPWFLPHMKGQIARYIIEGVASAGARLISHVVMNNHIHVLLFQGTTTLGTTMQPVLRRTALLVQNVHQVEGHVFERSFRCKQCESVEHVRNSIIYIHRNPVVAKLCKTAIEYEYSSARAYEGLEACGHICVEDGLQVFGCGIPSSIDELRSEYRVRVNKELLPEELSFFDFLIRRRRRRTTIALTRWSEQSARPATDIHDAARRILKIIDADVETELVRSRCGGARIVAARHQLIASLLQRGYTGTAIASYLRIGSSTVSRVRMSMRMEQLTQAGG